MESNQNEKYLAFKSLGDISKNFYLERIKLSSGLVVIYSKDVSLLLRRSVNFGDDIIIVDFYDDGKKFIYSNRFGLAINKHDNETYLITAQKYSIDHCLKNNIIKNCTLFEKLEKKEDSLFKYKVMFDDNIKIDFNEIPQTIKKYFAIK